MEPRNVTDFQSSPPRIAPWDRFVRQVPAWYTDAKLGIFVHWGAYSVPAWAEPVGQLGEVDEPTWFRHCAYAEWYGNTIRLDGSPAQRHHRETYGGAPYDDFLDMWQAQAFDAEEMVGLFRRAGARYVIPTTKHHDGIALWDAPGTGTRNTVRRGPKRDLVAEFERAARKAGMRFGVYYSGGLDWHVSDFPPHDTQRSVFEDRPNDATYAAYAYRHVRDLVDRYRPDLLWNDIDWPDAGKHDGPDGLAGLFSHYYERVPEGVVNDRWGETHWDFRTSEYQSGTENESAGVWENTRGIGLSFGYNQAEDATVSLDGPGLIRHLLDTVSRGGNLLINVGPDAAGRVPELQRRTLEYLADWMDTGAPAVFGTTPLGQDLARHGDDPWVRWTRSGHLAHAVIDARGTVAIGADADAFDLSSARLSDGTPVEVAAVAGRLEVRLPEPTAVGPAVVELRLRDAR